jgi:hypothetical protein
MGWSETQRKGDQQTIRVILDTGHQRLGAYRIRIDFDPEWDRVEAVTGGMPPFHVPPNVDVDPEVPGRFTISWMDLSGGGPAGGAHIATIQMRSNYRAQLRARILRALDAEGHPIEDASLTLQSGSGGGG